MDILRPICRYCIVDYKTGKEYGNTIWVLQGNNITKCNLRIMDVSIAWLAKKTNNFFGYYEVKTSYNALWNTHT